MKVERFGEIWQRTKAGLTLSTTVMDLARQKDEKCEGQKQFS